MKRKILTCALLIAFMIPGFMNIETTPSEKPIFMEEISEDAYKFYYSLYSVTFQNSLLIEVDRSYYNHTEVLLERYDTILKDKITYQYNTGDFEIDVSECLPE